jgi:hypothetical protein
LEWQIVVPWKNSAPKADENEGRVKSLFAQVNFVLFLPAYFFYRNKHIRSKGKISVKIGNSPLPVNRVFIKAQGIRRGNPAYFLEIKP